MKMEKLCLDRLILACILGSFISFLFKSSSIIIPPFSYAFGYFNSSIDSKTSILVSDFDSFHHQLFYQSVYLYVLQ